MIHTPPYFICQLDLFLRHRRKEQGNGVGRGRRGEGEKGRGERGEGRGERGRGEREREKGGEEERRRGGEEQGGEGLCTDVSSRFLEDGKKASKG